MNRSDLVAKLKEVEPALAVNPILPLLTHFWFTGRQLVGFNDQVALAVPFESDFKGAVPSKLLVLLNASGFSEIDVTERDGNLIVKERQGKTSIKLAMMPAEFVFKMPATGRGGKVSDDFVRKLEHCIPSIGTDTSVIDQLGVTVIPTRGAGCDLYATDGATMAKALTVQVSSERLILGGEFCRLLVSLAKRGKEKSEETAFEIGRRDLGGRQESYSLFKTGDVTLYGRLLTHQGNASPLNFASTMASLVPSNAQLFDIPDRFDSMVERARLVCDKGRLSAKLTVASGRLTMLSKTDQGEEVTDMVPVPRQQPELTVLIQPSFVSRGLGLRKMLVTEKCLIMGKGEDRYLVACRAGG